MAQGNEHLYIGRLNVLGQSGVAVTRRLCEIPTNIVGQISPRIKVLIEQGDTEFVVDFLGNAFIHRISGQEIFKQIQKGSGQNGK